MKKKVLIVIALIMVFLSFSYLLFFREYLNERDECNIELYETIDSIDKLIDKNPSFYKEEFIDEIYEIKNRYVFRTNEEIKELNNKLLEEINGNICLKDEYIQLDDEAIKEQINEFLSTYENYGVGKIFIYTDYNYGSKLQRSDDYVDCSIYAYGLSDETIIDKDSKIKIRGNSTSGANKKPYNIKFSDKVDLYGFGEAKKWSFLAEAFEPTMLRNHIFLDFAREMDLEYTSNCEYVELWLDGNYNGIYLLTESVETGKNRVDIDVDNGDFLFEYESSRAEDGVTYINTDHGWRFAMSDPDEPDEETIEYLNEKINGLDSIIYSNNYEEVEKLIDVDSFAKLYLLNEFAKTADFGYSSVNFYYKNDKFYAGPAWDFDQSSGNRNIGYSDYWISINKDSTLSYNGYEKLYCYNRNKIYYELLRYPEFKKLVVDYFEKYEYYITSLYAKDGIIDSILVKYGDLINNNYAPKEEKGAGWVCEYLVTDIIEYNDNVEYFKNWLNNRYEYLKKEWMD